MSDEHDDDDDLERDEREHSSAEVIVEGEDGAVRVLWLQAEHMQGVVDRLALVLSEHMARGDQPGTTYNAMQSDGVPSSLLAPPRLRTPSCWHQLVRASGAGQRRWQPAQGHSVHAQWCWGTADATLRICLAAGRSVLSQHRILIRRTRTSQGAEAQRHSENR